jgi:hypothetical protein
MSAGACYGYAHEGSEPVKTRGIVGCVVLGLGACGEAEDTPRHGAAVPPDASTAETSADAPPSEPVVLCDGSAGLRLAARVGITGTMVDAGRMFIYELGYEYLFVTGECHYWVNAIENVGHRAWYPTKEGVLSADDALALASDLRYSDWNALGGRVYEDSTVIDGVLTFLHDQTRKVVCYGNCISTDYQGDVLLKAEEVQAAIFAAWDWMTRLYAAGSPVGGPMRALALPRNPPMIGLATVPWPLKEPIDGFLAQPDANPDVAPQSFPVTDADDTAALRRLRQARIDDSFGGTLGGEDEIGIEQQGTAGPWLLYMRDTVPLEDDTGQIPAP